MRARGPSCSRSVRGRRRARRDGPRRLERHARTLASARCGRALNGALVRGDALRALARRPRARPARRRRAADPARPRSPDRRGALVQRGLELGLPVRTRGSGATSPAAVIDAVVRARGREAVRADLEAFYEREHDFFARPGRLRVRQLWCARTPARRPRAPRRARGRPRRASAPGRTSPACAPSRRSGDRAASRRAPLAGEAARPPRPDGARAGARAGGRGGERPGPLGDGVPRAQVIERSGVGSPRKEIADEVVAEYAGAAANGAARLPRRAPRAPRVETGAVLR